MDPDAVLDALLTAWKHDVESIPVPELVSVDIALAALAIERLVGDRRESPVAADAEQFLHPRH
ncbi:hypothetical protein [Amycolatopsis circi]|uniref:hypothetical protein n=1 Tax=Amycolatopsis circi TaxID=871959 RepID=UPI000E27A090|nr:hypothetical protein [Amycolatopsis circi]